MLSHVCNQSFGHNNNRRKGNISFGKLESGRGQWICSCWSWKCNKTGVDLNYFRGTDGQRGIGSHRWRHWSTSLDTCFTEHLLDTLSEASAQNATSQMKTNRISVRSLQISLFFHYRYLIFYVRFASLQNKHSSFLPYVLNNVQVKHL